MSQFQQRDYQVALYLAGRGILGPSTPDVRSGVQGPALITRVPHPEELLQPASLLPAARKALASFDAGQDDAGHALRIDDWDVRIQPLRATSQTCVQCHVRGSGGANSGLKSGTR